MGQPGPPLRMKNTGRIHNFNRHGRPRGQSIVSNPRREAIRRGRSIYEQRSYSNQNRQSTSRYTIKNRGGGHIHSTCPAVNDNGSKLTSGSREAGRTEVAGESSRLSSFPMVRIVFERYTPQQDLEQYRAQSIGIPRASRRVVDVCIGSHLRTVDER